MNGLLLVSNWGSKMALNWIEISKEALLNNIKVIKEKAKGKKILAVVKSNAYGHGLIEVSRILQDSVHAFVVADLEEGLELKNQLKDAKIILSLPPLKEKEIKETAESGFSIFAGNLEYISDLAKMELGKTLSVHVEINTGMNRSGLSPEGLAKALEIIQNAPHLSLEGIFSHYATLPENINFAKTQAERFRKVIKSTNLPGDTLIHMENSSGILKLLLDITNSVRPGISIYGLISSNSDNKLQPILSLKSTVIDIIRIRKGEGVSYDHLFKAPRDMWVATIPLGYGNGYMWNLKGKADVLFKGQRLPILGKVCMNHIIFDATKVVGYIKVGDVVTLIGKDGGEEITVAELAEKSKTINYEIVTKLSPKLKRVVV